MQNVIACVLMMLMLSLTVSAATFSSGSRGEEVKKLQQTLKDKGYEINNVDGIFGNETKNAVMYVLTKKCCGKKML